MNLQEDLKMKGELSIVVTGSNGQIKKAINIPNLVVTTGKQYIASRMAGTDSDVMSHMAIGSSSASPVVTDTQLGSQLAIVSLSSFTASSNTVTATATFNPGTGTGALTEAGIFNASSAGTMLCRTTFPVVNKEAGDTIAINWVITVS